MSEVKSIFGEFENPNAKNEEKVIKDHCHEFVSHYQSFIEILIIEDLRDKNNRRTINSKSLISNGMVMYLILETLVSQSIADYKDQYGNIGINTEDPTKLLDINGDALINGILQTSNIIGNEHVGFRG